MRANEFIIETQELAEIERLSKDEYEGGKSSLYDKQSGKQVKKLPGGSGLLYSTNEGLYGGIDIKLWDPTGKDYIAARQNSKPRPERQRGESKRNYEYRLWDWQRDQRDLNAPGQLVGKLSVSYVRGFPLKNAVQVDTITVDEDYRGIGLAKALYGIVLTILKRPLVSGSSQTPGGRRNWVSLASIPGVQMKGYIELEDDALDTDPRISNPRYAKQAEKNIDTIMGKLGGQYIGSRFDSDFFAFDVQPNTTGKELEGYVNTNLSKVYGGYEVNNTGLYAIWTGKQ